MIDESYVRSLEEENKKLRKEVESAKARADSLVSVIVNKGNKEEDNPLIREIKVRDQKIQKLNEEIGRLSLNSNKIQALESQISSLESQIAVLTEKRGWRKAADQKILESKESYANAVCLAVLGKSVNEIREELCINQRIVYRAISVREDTDLNRIKELYQLFPETFGSYGIDLNQLIDWFSGLRIKRLKLLNREEIVKRYGMDCLAGVTPDPYVKGEFYRLDKVKDRMRGYVETEENVW